MKNILEKLPLDDGLKCLRVADESKITINITTGRYETGEKPSQPLYSINDLRDMELPKEAKYIQFVPENTPFSVLDFDIDKTSTKEEVLEQMDYIENTILNQFEGLVEHSASGKGIHAYIEDKALKNLPSDPFKFYIEKISVEVFAKDTPIILTADYLDGKIVPFDTAPKKVLEAIHDKLSTIDTETPSERKLEPIETDKQSVISKADKMSNIERSKVGYRAGEDCSKIDFAYASMLLKASNNNKELSHSILLEWMEHYRPLSHSHKTHKEIANKAKRAIDSAYKKLSTPTTGRLKDIMIKRSIEAERIAMKMGKSRQLVKGMIFEGTLNTVVGISGSGKSKMITIMCMNIAKDFMDKLVYYFGPDLSVDDVKAINELKKYMGLDNFYLDQDSTGEEFLEMMENNGKDDEAKDIVFIVDTVKKITPVNNKDIVSANLKILKSVTIRGATGILIAHTNKDGKDMSGVAEFEQDVDNVIGVDVEYIGNDKMKSTMSQKKRCRSRITPITYEMSRDGFDYKESNDIVDKEAQAQKVKLDERKGNIEETIVSIVEEYKEEGKELNTSTLCKVILEDDYYSGSRKKEFILEQISKSADNCLISVEKHGKRKKLYKPIGQPGFLDGGQNEAV